MRKSIDRDSLLAVVDAIYGGESEPKKHEVRTEVDAYLSSGADNVFFSIADQALTVAIREHIDELMPIFLGDVTENSVDELTCSYHIAAPVISKAQRYLTDLDVAEGVDLGKSIRILGNPDYRSAVVGIVAEKFQALIRLLESRGIDAFETYGCPREVLGSGQAYEFFVSKIFADHGCQTEITKRSGDQGADIIGTYRNQRFIVQCKFYSGSVGNKAVQEAHAAKSFYRADLAIVVSNTNYTKSAAELADALRIPLLHHQDIGKFIEYLATSKER